jgi:hypothetical protein
MIKLNSRRPETYSNIAYVYKLKKNVDKEIEYYKKSLRYNKKDYVVYLNLGAAYEKKKMYNDALREYMHAYKLSPNLRRAADKIPQMKIRILRQKYGD